MADTSNSHLRESTADEPLRHNGGSTPAQNRSLSVESPLIFAALGIACLYAASQGMRITTLAGIYPVEESLVIRHLISTVAVLAVALLLRRRCANRFMGRIAAYGALSAILTIMELLRYSGIIFGATFSTLEYAGKITEEALLYLLILLWARHVIGEGLARCSTVVAYSFLAQAAFQVLLSFLQREACAVALSLLPLMSLFLFSAYVRSTDQETGQQAEIPASRPTKAPSISLALSAGVVFCLSLVLGGAIFESLGVQDAMADNPLAQLCIIAGNALAAFFLILTLPLTRNRSYGLLLLMCSFACCAISIYLATFLADEAVGAYLVVSSIGLRGTLMFIWLAAFLANINARGLFQTFVTLYVAHAAGKTVSSICMLLTSMGYLYAFNTLITLSLGFICLGCAMMAITLFDTSHSPSDPAEPRRGQTSTQIPQTAVPTEHNEESDDRDENARRSLFRESVDSLANEFGLTRQERRVLLLVAKGLNANAISEELVVSVNTAKSHMRNAYAKIGAHSQQEIIALVNARKEDLR